MDFTAGLSSETSVQATIFLSFILARLLVKRLAWFVVVAVPL